MKISRYLFVLAFIISAPYYSLAQRLGKAYEAIDYRARVNGCLVELSLANGYIGATALHLYLKGKGKPVFFQPASGEPDHQNRLKFEPYPQGPTGYFILGNMHTSYNKAPVFINGAYFLNDKRTSVKFMLINTHGH